MNKVMEGQVKSKKQSMLDEDSLASTPKKRIQEFNKGQTYISLNKKTIGVLGAGNEEFFTDPFFE
jgi:hypothetical protein